MPCLRRSLFSGRSRRAVGEEPRRVCDAHVDGEALGGLEHCRATLRRIIRVLRAHRTTPCANRSSSAVCKAARNLPPTRGATPPVEMPMRAGPDFTIACIATNPSAG
jgi:hypothetical protein